MIYKHKKKKKKKTIDGKNQRNLSLYPSFLVINIVLYGAAQGRKKNTRTKHINNKNNYLVVASSFYVS